MHPQSEPEIQTQQPERTRRCRHIFIAGHQCGSPCLRTEHFCYYHHTTRRPVADPKTRRARNSVYDLPNPEDRDSIRAAIAHNNIETHRASVLIYSLQTALAALPRETSEPAHSLAISAAASRHSRHSSPHNSRPVNHIPAPSPKPSLKEVVLDETHGLLVPEAFLDDPTEQDDHEEDPGDNVQEDGRLLRHTLGYKLLKEVELYEARQEGYEQARADLLKEGKLDPAQDLAKPNTKGIDIEAAADITVNGLPSNAARPPRFRARLKHVVSNRLPGSTVRPSRLRARLQPCRHRSLRSAALAAEVRPQSMQHNVTAGVRALRDASQTCSRNFNPTKGETHNRHSGVKPLIYLAATAGGAPTVPASSTGQASSSRRADWHLNDHDSRDHRISRRHQEALAPST